MGFWVGERMDEGDWWLVGSGFEGEEGNHLVELGMLKDFKEGEIVGINVSTYN